MTLFAGPTLSHLKGHIRVLIVDDSRADVESTNTALRACLGTHVAIAYVGSVPEAVTYLEQRRVDVIVLELSHRGALGIEALGQLRSTTPFVPVVVLTRYHTEALALQLLRDGAQECLPKADTSSSQLGRVVLYAIERQRHIALLETARIEAAHRATHDPLTGLANRELFLDQFDRAIALGNRHSRMTGLLFVDLDGFKNINDTYGHNCGDIILRHVANRLIDSVRRSDAVARLGGDEFVVLLRDITSREDISQVSETVLLAVRKPIVWGTSRQLCVDASIGGAMAPLDGDTVDSLLNAADLDMYREKMLRRRDRMGTPALAARSLIAALGDLQLAKPEARLIVHETAIGEVAIGLR